jgi:hypothetical protein
MGVVVKGFKEKRAEVKNYGDKLNARVLAEARASAMTIARNAKRAAPRNHGMLKRGISFKQLNPTTFQVVSASHYSAYMEWGTKKRFNAPADEQAVAAQHKGKGLTGSLSFKEAIYAWAKRKRIDKKLWFVIMRSIGRNGVKGHHFLYPAFKAEKRNFLERIKRITKK